MRLTSVQRPSRYINNEVNSIHKDGGTRVALAFPDVYDVGMSHLGLKVLYHILNSMDGVCAERVFHPWTDMEAAMRASGETLRSLESGTPVREFALLGFSLQYELSYTSVLNMLELAGIPLRAGERNSSHPIVVAGGPCTINPHPVARFFDALLIGDGEEAAPEMVRAVEGRTRDAALKALAAIPGVYVPALHGPEHIVERRHIKSLDAAPFPTCPVVPYNQIIHDRVSIEVSRGCARGCRFCQAGMIYRPVRERSVGTILDLASQSVQNTGHDEVSLTSLSAGDYPRLLELMRGLNERFAGQRVAISLPSLRVGAVERGILREIRSVRKTGFTIAPEAATDRLRAVINKDFTQEDFERAAETLFSEGWLNLKLYYMLGLPTETGEDIDAIPRMAQEAMKMAKKHARRNVTISVSASPFVPKAHTPFQWFGQFPTEYFYEVRDRLRNPLKRFSFKTHDPRTSRLEAAFARGDASLALLAEAAHRHGARLDAWSECFDEGAWTRAAEETGIDISACATRQYGVDEPLPWDNISTGISRKFLAREHARALDAARTPGCAESCTACGLKCRAEGTAQEAINVSAAPLKPIAREARTQRKPVTLRVRFEKTGPLRYLSHRELITHLTRALLRTGIRMEYSQGFHPAPKLSFGPPLGVGVEGSSEYFDMTVEPTLAIAELMERTNAFLGRGMRLIEIVPIDVRTKSLQAFIVKYVYEISGADTSGVEEFMARQSVISARDKGPMEIRPMIVSAEVLGPTSVRVAVRDLEADKRVRLDEITSLMLGTQAEALDIRRVDMLGNVDGKWMRPLEAV